MCTNVNAVCLLLIVMNLFDVMLFFVTIAICKIYNTPQTLMMNLGSLIKFL